MSKSALEIDICDDWDSVNATPKAEGQHCAICDKNKLGQIYADDRIQRKRRFYFDPDYSGPICGTCVKFHTMGRCGK